MQSAHDPRLLVGLGAVEDVTGVIIRWPSGTVSKLAHLKSDKTYEIVEPRDRNERATAVSLP